MRRACLALWQTGEGRATTIARRRVAQAARGAHRAACRRACSSVGQSGPLITAWSQVRALPGAPAAPRVALHTADRPQGAFMASTQYVYVMKDLTKAFPGGREVFKGITLSFLPGVKIGVLGVNGAGKSTLLKIMAG